MSVSDVKQELKTNKGILYILLSKEDCPICGDFRDVIEKIEPAHSEYLTVFEFDIKDIEEFQFFPHNIYPMSYFYIYGKQEFPFIRAGFVQEDVLNGEILKFKRILDGEDMNEVFN